MLESLVYYKTLPFCTVLMDSWYATKDLMQYIDKLGKYYYCPLKKNRLRLKDLAYQTGQSVYQLKHGLLSNYLIAQLKRSPLAMSLVYS